MEQFFFDGWSGPLRILLVGVLAYVALVLFLRLSGKRTLSKMNAFDLVVTVALGSTLATVLLSSEVTLTEGLIGLLLLIALQFAVSWSSVRSLRVRHFAQSQPTLLLHRGRMLEDALRKQRISTDDVRAAIRGAGQRRVEDVEAVVLETDGSLSVVPLGAAPASILDGVDSGSVPIHSDSQ